MVVRELGPAERKDYEDMVAGKLIVPPPGSFSPCFHPVADEVRPFDLGFDDMRLGTVSKLRPGSPAAGAGVEEGDTIVSLTPLARVREHPDRMMELVLRRGGKTETIRYLPRDAAVEAWHWVRNPNAPASACRL
jgi:S1-C subfamily serine protease